MIETFEDNKKPKSSPEELRGFIGEVLQDESLDVNKISAILEEIKAELTSMYTAELLNKSHYWHAFASSTIRSEEESLPESTENGVGLVIENLIERKLKPVLRN